MKTDIGMIIVGAMFYLGGIACLVGHEVSKCAGALNRIDRALESLLLEMKEGG